MNRRELLRAMAGIMASGSQWSAAGPAIPTHSVPARLWDVHLHLTRGWYGDGRGPVTAEHALRWMDAHGIEKAAVLPLVSPEAFWYPISTDDVLEQTLPHRERLIPFCALDPRTLETHLTTDADLETVLSRFRDAGAKGFGEHKAKLAIDAPANLRLYAACEKLKLPILFHLDNAANMDQPGLPGLEQVVRMFPGLIMIGHGKGWWASIAGGLQQADLHVGYPKGPVAPGGALDRLLGTYSNLYGDLSSSGAHALLRDASFGRAFLIRHADRLLFGTDYYDLQQKDFDQFDLLKRLDAPPDVRQKIESGNLRAILNM